MADLKLSDGREISFDMNAITLGEWRMLFDSSIPTEDDDIIMAKAAGLAPEELSEIGYQDYRELARAFFKKAREPLADPNLPSESISTSSGESQPQSS